MISDISDPSLEEKFWLVHGIIKVYPLSEGLNQVKEFLKNSEDIIIWQTGGFEQVLVLKLWIMIMKTFFHMLCVNFMFMNEHICE